MSTGGPRRVSVLTLFSPPMLDEETKLGVSRRL
jgi:hypothetical protein